MPRDLSRGGSPHRRAPNSFGPFPSGRLLLRLQVGQQLRNALFSEAVHVISGRPERCLSAKLGKFLSEYARCSPFDRLDDFGHGVPGLEADEEMDVLLIHAGGENDKALIVCDLEQQLLEALLGTGIEGSEAEAC